MSEERSYKEIHDHLIWALHFTHGLHRSLPGGGELGQVGRFQVSIRKVLDELEEFKPLNDE